MSTRYEPIPNHHHWHWRQAQMLVHGLHGHRIAGRPITFRMAMEKAKRRYKRYARLPGFEKEARERWEREEKWICQHDEKMRRRRL